jgi:MFS family permease
MDERNNTQQRPDLPEQQKQQGQQKEQRGALLRDRNFLWLMVGGIISMLGDQFTLLALPWLVLQMTGDPLQLGTVLALTGIPRAALILFGGALVDHYSPKSVLMLTKYVNTVLLGLLAFLVLGGQIQMWMVYLISLGIGVSTAFSIPSGSTILPRVVAREQFQPANGMMLGLRQLTMFAGPLLAALLIAIFGDSGHGTVSDSKGLGAAFLFDAFSFALSAWTLSKVIMRDLPVPVSMPVQEVSGGGDASPKAKPALFKAVWDGLLYCWRDQGLRTCFAYWAAIAFFISGPIQVAMPVLATQMQQGAAGLGMLMGAHGAGTLLGMAFSGMKPRLRLGSLGGTILLVDTIVGFLFMPMGMIHAVWQGSAILLVIGVLGGFIQVAIFTWMQQQVAPAMLGRIMSIFMFIFMGIAPVSAAATGWLMRNMKVGELFVFSGAMLLVIVVGALLVTPMRSVQDAQGQAGM